MVQVIHQQISADSQAWLNELKKTRSIEECARIESVMQWIQSQLPDCLAEGISVGQLLAHLELDVESITASLLLPVIEIEQHNWEVLATQFGSTVVELLRGSSELNRFHQYRQTSDAKKKSQLQSDQLRKMLLAMVRDVRVVLIKLAQRVHEMRSLRGKPGPEREEIAAETMDIFAPLANRLGIWQIKWELEDYALRYLEPETYKKIARSLDERRIDRERYISNVTEQLQQLLTENGVTKAEVSGRPKHITSIWRKMQRKNLDFDQIFDVRAVRVLVPTLADCYLVLGLVHGLWRHIPKEFDDYIANPKGNNYQSLHTAVIGPEGKPLEVQIRTFDMHHHAELGLAAHWKYKEGGTSADDGFERKINWLRQLLDWKTDDSNQNDLLDKFQAEVMHDRVYVMTPKGAIIDLPQGATPLDFAYTVHTDIGHRCRGAKVNGAMVPLTYQLSTGQQVEILTISKGQPSRDWLNPRQGYLQTPRAISKVRHWFKQQDLDKNIASGRDLIERELKRLRLSDLGYEPLAKRFQCEDINQLFAQVGQGEISIGQITHAVQDLLEINKPKPKKIAVPSHNESNNEPTEIHIADLGSVETTLAGCCQPEPWEPIIGYLSISRGVIVHRGDCPNLQRQAKLAPERLLDVNWAGKRDNAFTAMIHIEAKDRTGLLRDVGTALATEGIHTLALNTLSDTEGNQATMQATVEAGDLTRLSSLMDRISRIVGVIDVRRV